MNGEAAVSQLRGGATGPAVGREEELRPGHGREAEHAGHGSPGFYWMIGGILTVITAVEVAVFYIPALGTILVPTLLLLSATKFLMVVMFFMHLKFDSRIFGGVFTAGMVLAVFMTTALTVLYKVLP